MSAPTQVADRWELTKGQGSSRGELVWGVRKGFCSWHSVEELQ